MSDVILVAGLVVLAVLVAALLGAVLALSEQTTRLQHRLNVLEHGIGRPHRPETR